jgi:hypothetical protein
MPRGGARKGAGRKPKPLAEKLSAGNLGHRPLSRLNFVEKYSDQREPPDYLDKMVKKQVEGLPTPSDIYKTVVKELQPSGCLDLISTYLLCDFALAKYYLINAQYELSQTATVAYNEKHELEMTSFAEAMIKLQKTVIDTWLIIWSIIEKNSTKSLVNPEEDLILAINANRARRKPRRTADGNDYPENSG